MSLLAILLPLLTIDIDINPTIGEFGGFELSWHGLGTAVGIGVALWLTVRLSSFRRIDPDEAYTIGLLAIVGGIIGARTLFVIENWSDFENDLADVFALNEGGISIYGALIGGVLFGFGYAFLRRSAVPVWKMADSAVPGVILGMAIGRIGDIINGEHFAESSDLPWAVRYVHPDSPSFGLPAQHPAVAYEMLGDLAIMGILLLIFFRVRGDGWAFFSWVLLYGVLRFFVSFLREDKLVLDGLRMAQVIALVGIAAGVLGLVWLAVRQRRGGPTRAERRRAARTPT